MTYPPPRMQRAVYGLLREYMNGTLAHGLTRADGGKGCAICAISRGSGGIDYFDAISGRVDSGYRPRQLDRIEIAFERPDDSGGERRFTRENQDPFAGLCDVFDTLLELDPYPDQTPIRITDVMEVAL